jgi:membrane protein DedA with SNARE-associated domain
MQATVAILIHHGYLVLFVWVFLEQLGLPVPSLPMLLAAGALAGSGRLDLRTALSVAVLAAYISDGFWFCFGRRRGKTVLQWICKISLEPDSCVRRTEDVYVRYGAKSLLVAKFIPGFGIVAPPLAGISRMPLYRFVLFDGFGVLIWTGCYIGLGYVFTDQLEDVASYALRLGEFLVVLLAGVLATYIGFKYVQRRRVLRELRIARVTPEELKRMLEAGERVQIVDLRHALDFEAEPVTLPGAIHVDPQDIDRLVSEIANDRDVILYCT